MQTERRERGTARPGKRAARAQPQGRGGTPLEEPRLAGSWTRLASRPAIRRAGVGAALAFLLAVAVVVRVGPAWSTVFSGPAGVRLFDTDSYYHLRHAAYAARHFPHLQPWDPGIYPAGQPKRYAGLFDVVIGGAALIAGAGHPDDRLLTKVAAWTPPVLGVLGLLALFWMGRRARSVAAALTALVLVTLYPGSFVQRSLLGAVDHHVAEVLLALLTGLGLVASAARAVPTENVDPEGERLRDGRAALRRWAPDFTAPLPLVLFLFTWFGAPIYLVLVMVTYSGAGALLSARDGAAPAFARAAFRYGAGLLVLLLAAWLLAPGLVMDEPYFRKTLLAAALFTVGVPGFLFACQAIVARVAPAGPDRSTGRGRAALFVTAAAVAALLIGFAWAGSRIPAGRQLLGELLGVKTNLVKEQAGVGLGRFAFLGGAPALLAFAALPLGAVAVWRRRGRNDPKEAGAELGRLMLALFGTMIVLLWLRTHDYGYVAPPFLAWLAADVLAHAMSWLRGPRARLAAGVVAAGMVVVPVWPGGATAPAKPDADVIRELMVLRPGWEEALAWMRTSTPPLPRPLDAPVPEGARFRHPPGNYGVLAFWDFGHYVAQLGARPPLASGGISTSTAAWFLIDDEDAAVRALGDGLRAGERVRYCLVDGQTAGDFFLSAVEMAGANVNDYVELFAPEAMPQKRLMRFNARYQRSMVARLYEGDGLDLGHFRLVYASPERNLLAYHAPLGAGVIVRKATRFFDVEERALWERSLSSHRPVVLSDEIVSDGRIEPAVKVFEHVAGARLVGQATPGAAVEASLELVARAAGHSFRYSRVGRAGANGRYELVVPYPTAAAGSQADVWARGDYELRTTDGAQAILVAQAHVSEADLEEGRTVAVAPLPDVGSPPAAPMAAPAREPVRAETPRPP